MRPTVLTNTNPRMKVVQEEIFGPVVCAVPFDDADLDAIAQAGQRHRLWPGRAACGRRT